jgi:hypothetical protein
MVTLSTGDDIVPFFAGESLKWKLTEVSESKASV